MLPGCGSRMARIVGQRLSERAGPCYHRPLMLQTPAACPPARSCRCMLTMLRPLPHHKHHTMLTMLHLPARQVDLVGHSAGGWLGRAFLADPKYMDSSSRATGQDDGLPHNAAVASLVTLGTPHAPPPPGSKARDMTGGALTWVHNTYPGGLGRCWCSGAAVAGTQHCDGVHDGTGHATWGQHWDQACMLHSLTSNPSCVMVLMPACRWPMAGALVAGVLLTGVRRVLLCSGLP
jgi:hypothetical protein